MRAYYEYDGELWIREHGKHGGIRLFCLTGKDRGKRWIVSKENFSQCKKLKKKRDFERIKELIEKK